MGMLRRERKRNKDSGGIKIGTPDKERKKSVRRVISCAHSLPFPISADTEATYPKQCL